MMGDLPKNLEKGAAFLDEQIAKSGLTIEESVKRLLSGRGAAVSVCPPATAQAQHCCTEVILQRGDTITPVPIRWLWPGWLAGGKMHILAGAPGTGKTTLALALAATVTTGGRWPDGAFAEKGKAVIWSGEDDTTDTLAPRLHAAGADMSLVHFITGSKNGEERRAFDPATDIGALRDKLIQAGNVRLLVVDPIVSAVAGDSHKSAEVRRGLAPLADLAAEAGCALLGISHFSKGTAGRDPTERITGSLAFGAVARIVMVAAKRKEEEANAGGDRVLCRCKSNIGTDTGGFAYSLRQTELDRHPGIFASYVLWGDAIEGTAREILAEAEAVPQDDGECGALAEAKQFLSDLLAQGPLPAKTIMAESIEAGFKWATIRRVQKVLGIKPEKRSFARGWFWSLSGEETTKMLKNPEDAQQNNVSIFGKIEHLRKDRPDEIMTEGEEVAIRAWLANIGEHSQEIIDDVLAQCQRNAEARGYYIRRAGNAAEILQQGKCDIVAP